jgi:hypothetical protein
MSGPLKETGLMNRRSLLKYAALMPLIGATATSRVARAANEVAAAIPSAVDGSAEEGSPFIPPHSVRRLAFTPKPAGFRFVRPCM